MGTPRIPNTVAAVVGDVLGSYYFSHQRLNTLFLENGAPGDPPVGNCVEKCTAWLRRAGDDPAVDSLAVLGGVTQDIMDGHPIGNGNTEDGESGRRRIRETLAKAGMTYGEGGQIFTSAGSAAPRTLAEVIRQRDLNALELEFNRAVWTIESDPAAAVTAACAIVEALCRVFIEDESLDMPADQSIKPLWRVVQSHLGMNPADTADDDLKRMFSGLISILDGLGAFRTHVGSAHGRGRAAFDLHPRHARLAVNAAHTLTVFVIETWESRKTPRH